MATEQADVKGVDGADKVKAATDVKNAAVEGAQTIGDAVKKVVDAAVAEIRKQPIRANQNADFDAQGTAGGRFTIDGVPGSFGTNGTVMLGNEQISTTEWSSQRIKGNLPAHAKSGPIRVIVDPDTVKHGYLNVSSK